MGENMEEQIEKLEIINPKKNWVIGELKLLIKEWENWQKEIALIKDHPYDTNTCSKVYADGGENMEKHIILQAKTLTFLNNNIKGHGFIKGVDGKSCDRTDLRLSFRVKHRVQELRILSESLQYALMPEAYLVHKAKGLADKVIAAGTDVGAKIILEQLKKQ